MKKFNIPQFYRSNLITKIKRIRESKDPRKKDYSPSILDYGSVQFLIARHFGFCYGVENAIEISYKAIEENPDKRIFLLSEMIHNPEVNRDLQSRGVKFISDTRGNQLIPWTELNSSDIVIIPAFGTTVETQKILNEAGVDTVKYDTTCPFVEKVWNRASALGKTDYTVIVHGKFLHEETRATFSHSKEYAHTMIVRNIEEAKTLGKYILNEIDENEFLDVFKDKISEGFKPDIHLTKIGVVNQTTMLATETQAIADYLKEVMERRYGLENIKEHFADTRDTLCYATHDNQRATLSLIERGADIAIVVGGYNSSNTSHIVELCEEVFPTYFISGADKILNKNEILHYDFHSNKEKLTSGFIPDKQPVKIILTSGASCPDTIVDEVLFKILSFFETSIKTEDLIKSLEDNG